jgi:hypothetical protein
VGEFDKPAGATVLALAPGRYQLRTRHGDSLLQSVVEVPAFGGQVLRALDLQASSLETASAKGSAGLLSLYAGLDTGNAVVATRQPLLGAGLRVETSPLRGAPPWNVSLAFDYGRASAPGAFVEDDYGLYLGNAWAWRMNAWVFRAGLDLGATAVRESKLPVGAPRAGLEPGAGATASARFELASHLWAYAEVRGGPSLVGTVSGTDITWSGSTQLGLSFGGF